MPPVIPPGDWTPAGVRRKVGPTSPRRGAVVRRAPIAMDRITPISAFTVPLGGQRVELQQVDYAAGGMSLLRVRIREGARHTVFEIDARTAGLWACAMAEWAAARDAQEVP